MLGGTIGYIVIEGYSPIDALYMAVITLGTVGFREVHPLSDAGKLFTVLLIVAGIGTMAYAVSQTMEFVIRRLLFRRRKMDRSIHKLERHVIICGYGRMGREIALRLKQ